MGLITIATDFGTADGYTAAMKGVIKSIAPDVEIIDVTSDLSGIAKTSLVLERYYSRYPEKTVHLVVVDPTIGSDRKPLIGWDSKYFFVGPDNGIFTPVASNTNSMEWWTIDISALPSREISRTFHGRDIFAPAAALLSKGRKPDDLGKRVDKITVLAIPLTVSKPDYIEGEIIDIDNFGNLITNMKSDMIADSVSIALQGKESVRFVRTYCDVPMGSPLAYIGSSGFLEIGVNLGRADKYFNAEIGWKVVVSS